MNVYLESHLIDVDSIRQDDFNTYFEKRTEAIYDLIEKATGKEIQGRGNVDADFDDDDNVEEQEIFL